MKTPHPFHIHVPREPVDLWEKLRQLASREQHLLKVEALNALIAHLQSKGMLTDQEIKKTPRMSRWSSSDLAQALADNPSLRLSPQNPPLELGSHQTRQKQEKSARGSVGLKAIPHSPCPLGKTTPTSFMVVGSIVAKPRQTRSDKWKERPAVMKYRNYADRICSYARAAGIGENPPTYGISVDLYFPIPKYTSKMRRKELMGAAHRVKPDGDNCLKGILDALYPNDSMVAEMTVRKFWEDEVGPRTVITLW